jgi:hypothetical protein
MHGLIKLLITGFFIFKTVNARPSEIQADFSMRHNASDHDFGSYARVETLSRFDKFLDWILKQTTISYKLKAELPPFRFTCSAESLIEYGERHGYFSKKNPIIARVTKSQEDIVSTQKLFLLIHEHIKEKEQRRIAIGEALAKVLAYRDLQEGYTIDIPSFDDKKPCMIAYVVDKVFDLWHKMPAFGLVSRDKKNSSILLYRGTDLSLDSKSGWASVLADFDLSGPGFSVFSYAREEIALWLKKVAMDGQKACVFGFSLGGILTMYTAILEGSYIQNQLCMAFNPPGVSKTLFHKWDVMMVDERPELLLFVNRGDPVPKWGYLTGNKAYEFAVKSIEGPIQAHNTFMNSQKHFDSHEIDLEEENKERSL